MPLLSRLLGGGSQKIKGVSEESSSFQEDNEYFETISSSQALVNGTTSTSVNGLNGHVESSNQLDLAGALVATWTDESGTCRTCELPLDTLLVGVDGLGFGEHGGKVRLIDILGMTGDGSLTLVSLIQSIQSSPLMRSIQKNQDDGQL
jgi:hypothetical protein